MLTCPISYLYNLIWKLIYLQLRHDVFKGIGTILFLKSVLELLCFRIYIVPDIIICCLVKASNVKAFTSNLIIRRGAPTNISWCELKFPKGPSRIVQLLFTNFVPDNCLIFSESLLFNIKHRLSIKPCNNDLMVFRIQHLTDYSPRLALNANLNLVNSPYDYDSKIMTEIIKNFMSKSHYVYPGDLITIDCQVYSSNITSKYIYYRVNSVIPKDTISPESGENFGFLISDNTTIFQLNSISSFIPSKNHICINQKLNNLVISACPPCFNDLAVKINLWFKPFLQGKINDLLPFFLIASQDRLSTTILLEACSMNLGVHFLKVDCNNFFAGTSAQIQANMKNNLKCIKSVAPVVVVFSNIELLWNDTEGYDADSLLLNFVDSVETLSKQCCRQAVFVASVKDLADPPPVIRSLVLATSSVPILTDSLRAAALAWLSSALQIPPMAPGVAEKLIHDTSSYTFGDLRMLLALGTKQWYCTKTAGVIEFDHFKPVLEKMRKVERVVESGSVEWGDVGGVEEVKIAVAQSVAAGRVSKGFRRTGILLHGPPGTGKTLLARAVAAQSSAAFIPVKGPELLNMYVGQSEANVRQVFKKAKEVSPCILFFDELDSLAPNRGTKSDSASVMDRVVSQLLAEMDSLESSDQVFILAATNRPDLLDPALLRPGRLDKMLYVGPCSELSSKEQVFKAVTRKFLMGTDVDIPNIIDLLPHEVTGAQVYSVCYSAWMYAASELINSGSDVEESKVSVCQRHFQAALENT